MEALERTQAPGVEFSAWYMDGEDNITSVYTCTTYADARDLLSKVKHDHPGAEDYGIGMYRRGEDGCAEWLADYDEAANVTTPGIALGGSVKAELLEALAACITMPGAVAHRDHCQTIRRLGAINDIARAAIAKAKGES